MGVKPCATHALPDGGVDGVAGVDGVIAIFDDLMVIALLFVVLCCMLLFTLLSFL